MMGRGRIMLFNSMTYVVFLPLVFSIYWMVPHRYRWIILFTSSYYFYMSWNPKYVVLILFTTLISYTAGILIEKESDKAKRKLVVGFSAVACLAVVFFFKYFNFFSQSAVSFLNLFSLQLHPITLNVILPVGISFYTFQTLSYVVDVYRGEIPAEHHFGIYATFISFFPQLVAGPIERTSNLLPQIKKEHRFDSEKAITGCKLMLWGFFKKLIIADYVSPFVDQVFAAPQSYVGFDLLLAMFAFTLQIYCDFSGYSDIAIGSAKLMDIDLMINFKSPYFSSSIKEFWSRWHISLSTWFRDYVYIPLGGNRCSPKRQSLNVLITFLASGLWHGANWTFVIWGGIHGVAQIIESNFLKSLNKVKEFKIGYAFSILIVFIFCNFAWVFFRAASLANAQYILTHMFDGISNPVEYFGGTWVFTRFRQVYIAVLTLLLGVYDRLNINNDFSERPEKRGKVLDWAFYFVIGLLIIFLSKKGDAAEFVYFQF